MVESYIHRRISVHQALGAGPVADVLLWRKWCASVAMLVCGTIMWFLFTRCGYNPLSVIANVLFLLVVILFFWAKSASLLNRPLPPIPDLEVSDKTIEEAADIIRGLINRALAVAHEIAVSGNLRILVQVAALLWLISLIGSLFSFLTFVYIGFLLALSAPILYEKHQDRVNDNMWRVLKLFDAGYKKLDKTVLRRIPVSLYKKKKTQ